MKKISDSRSPFVVNLIGCCTLQEPFCLVLEYVAHGDLLTYLRAMRKKVKVSMSTSPAPFTALLHLQP